MRRREFITLIGGAAGWPLAARAQQPAMPLIAYLSPTSSAIPQDRLRAFRQGLKETGYVDGENVTITYRFAEGQNDRLPALAAELVRGQIAVIVTGAPQGNTPLGQEWLDVGRPTFDFWSGVYDVELADQQRLLPWCYVVPYGVEDMPDVLATVLVRLQPALERAFSYRRNVNDFQPLVDCLRYLH